LKGPHFPIPDKESRQRPAMRSDAAPRERLDLQAIENTPRHQPLPFLTGPAHSPEREEIGNQEINICSQWSVTARSP
jgi:hypothetical protein